MKGNVINISIVINKRKKVAKKENYQNQKSKHISGFDKEKCEKCALTPFHHKWGATKRSGVEAKPTVGDRG
jgi:hypothetical protein